VNLVGLLDEPTLLHSILIQRGADQLGPVVELLLQVGELHAAGARTEQPLQEHPLILQQVVIGGLELDQPPVRLFPQSSLVGSSSIRR
jgi:hypothetical protein